MPRLIYKILIMYNKFGFTQVKLQLTSIIALHKKYIGIIVGLS